MDRTKLSFSEAENKAKFPAILKWGEIDQRLRSALWTPLFIFFDDHIEYDQYADSPQHYLTPPRNGHYGAGIHLSTSSIYQ
jgi:hypothetical protein